MSDCVIYARWARWADEQTQEVDEEAQIQECREFAERCSLRVKNVWKDLSEEGRPGLLLAMQDLDKGDVLLMHSPAILAVDAFLMELFRLSIAQQGARIVYTHEDVEPEDDAKAHIRRVVGSIAHYERLLTTARRKAEFRQRQSAGKRMSRWAPYGWAFDKSETGETIMVPAPFEQEAVRKIREMADQGAAHSEIVKFLNASNYRQFARAGKWNQTSVMRIADAP
jgi:DNA invertase Pin-like site-specific DNA recombinase